MSTGSWINLTALLVLAYLLLNSGEKQVLGVHGFAFPLLLTSCHMGFSFLILLPFMLREPFVGKHRATLAQQWKGLVAIGLFMAANISLNNISLVFITLSLNQVIRSAMPVAVAALAAVIEQKVPTSAELVALLVLSVGSMVAMWEGSVSGSLLGVLLAATGLFSNAAMISTTGKVLSEKLDVLRLAFYTAPISCAVLLPFFFIREQAAFVSYQRSRGLQEVATILVCSSAVALAYNVVLSLTIRRLSSTGAAVLGIVKTLALLSASAMLLDEKRTFTLKMSLGIVLALGGFFMFSYIKLEQQTCIDASSAHQTKVEQPATPELSAMPLLSKA